MKKVTCWYCDYYELFYKYENDTFKNTDFGFCTIKGKCRKGTAHICDNFTIRKGLFTLKDYPNKNKKKTLIKDVYNFPNQDGNNEL